MIVFENAGEIDPRLITTLGINVKEGPSAIGFFGTGLKYAIAVLLREGQSISIQTGGTTCTFHVKPQTVRGKEFDFITMVQNGILASQLGFTTELGKNWSLREAYRELHCNCLDEGGQGGREIMDGSPAPRPIPGLTRVIVTGASFTHMHYSRDSFILNKEKMKLLDATDRLEVYLGKSKSVFYRGVKVYESEKEFAYTYNILSRLDLTEDRTAHYWDVELAIRAYLTDDDAPEVIVADSIAQEGVREQKIDFQYAYVSPQFARVTKRLMAERPQSLNKSAIEVYYKGSGGEPDYDHVSPSGEQARAIARKLEWCLAIGFDLSQWEIVLVRSLGDGVLAKASAGKVYLTPQCLERGLLREALIEEHIHLAHRVADFTREMQNVLFGHLVRLGSELITAREKTDGGEGTNGCVLEDSGEAGT